MKRKTCYALAAIAALMFAMANPVFAQKEEGDGGTGSGSGAINEARPGFIRDTRPPLPDRVEIMEGFDDITNLPGWDMINNSAPVGTTDWFQGNSGVFPAHMGAATAYIAANFNNTAGVGTISNWLITPEIDFDIFDTMTFFTRTVTGNTFPDRLEVRVSNNGASSDVGTGATDVGDFTDLVLSINPTLTLGGYPQTYTQFTVNRADLASPSGSGRIAFRYFVTGGGPAGNNSNYIGIDTLDITELPVTIPTLGEWGLIAFVLLLMSAAVFFMKRRRLA